MCGGHIYYKCQHVSDHYWASHNTLVHKSRSLTIFSATELSLKKEQHSFHTLFTKINVCGWSSASGSCALCCGSHSISEPTQLVHSQCHHKPRYKCEGCIRMGIWHKAKSSLRIRWYTATTFSKMCLFFCAEIWTASSILVTSHQLLVGIYMIAYCLTVYLVKCPCHTKDLALAPASFPQHGHTHHLFLYMPFKFCANPLKKLMSYNCSCK